MRIALAQIDSTVGDIEGNCRLIVDRVRQARDNGAGLVVFPELAVSGYPPEDLLLKDHFLTDCAEALREIARAAKGTVAVVGAPLWEDGECYNAAAVLGEGETKAVYRKIWLPNYGVFDEKRYFTPGEKVLVAEVGGVKTVVSICEDIWRERGPCEVGACWGQAPLIVNLSMSPYHRGKGLERAEMLAGRAHEAGAYVVYVNGVGGQDELVFDGQSMVLDPSGRLLARAAQFEEELLTLDLDQTGLRSRAAHRSTPTCPALWPVEEMTVSPAAEGTVLRAPAPAHMSPVLGPEEEVYRALTLGVRDYSVKNGFEEVVIGISGGIDSALTACIAVDALGADRVNLVSMPSRFSSEGTRSDAREVAERLGAKYLELPIEHLYAEYLAVLAGYLQNRTPGITEQNIQARIRGNLLMALSNEFGWLVLTTGNKSEIAVGYCTLYGDMAGGYSALKDVPKTLVYKLAEHRDSLDPGEGPIPASTLVRAPSAELAPDQTDQDTLPAYGVLDRIIEAYVVNDESIEEMVAAGLEDAVVRRVVRMIDGNEYKRRQSAPGVKITPKAFGKDRRLPITNRYRG